MSVFRMFAFAKLEASLGHLRWLAWLATVANMTMMIWSWLEGPDGPPARTELVWVFLAALLIYVGPKEVNRMQSNGSYKSRSAGEIFPLIWVVLLILMSFTAWRRPDLFQFPNGMMETTLGAAGIFIISRTMKEYHHCRSRKNGCDEKKDGG